MNHLPLSQAFGEITEQQQRGMDEDAEIVARRRQRAQYEPIMEVRPTAAGEINCARCERLGDFNAEHQRGWCMSLRFMVSTWHPARCVGFKAAA